MKNHSLAAWSAAALVTLGLAACTSAPAAPETSAPASSASAAPSSDRYDLTDFPLPQVGDCLADVYINPVTEAKDADLSSVVPCTEPHRYMVYGIVEVPDGFLAETSTIDDELDQYEMLVHPKDGIFGGLLLMENQDACAATLVDVIGDSDFAFSGSGATAAEALIQIGGSLYEDISAVTPGQWVAGKKVFVCTMAWYTDEGDIGQGTLPAGMTVADYHSPEFPLRFRQCFTFDDYVKVSCDQPHYYETLAYFDARRALTAEQFATLPESWEEFTEEHYAVLDAACDEWVQHVTGASDPSRYYGTGYPLTEHWSPTGNRYFECQALYGDGEHWDLTQSVESIGDAEPRRVAVPQ